jgi:hypothetical protein
LAGVVIDADRGAALVAVCVPVLGLAGALPVASASLTGTSVRKIATIPHLTAVRSPAGAPRAQAGWTIQEGRPVQHDLLQGSRVHRRLDLGRRDFERLHPRSKAAAAAQLADAGVKTTIPEISGARSIIETWHGYPKAATVAQNHIQQGFRGCWIMALGTN